MTREFLTPEQMTSLFINTYNFIPPRQHDKFEIVYLLLYNTLVDLSVLFV